MTKAKDTVVKKKAVVKKDTATKKQVVEKKKAKVTTSKVVSKVTRAVKKPAVTKEVAAKKVPVKKAVVVKRPAVAKKSVVVKKPVVAKKSVVVKKPVVAKVAKTAVEKSATTVKMSEEKVVASQKKVVAKFSHAAEKDRVVQKDAGLEKSKKESSISEVIQQKGRRSSLSFDADKVGKFAGKEKRSSVAGARRVKPLVHKKILVKKEVEPELAIPKVLNLGRQYSVIEVAKAIRMVPSVLVGFFVKRGKFFSLNDIVPKEDIEAFASEWGVELVQPVKNAERTPVLHSSLMVGDAREGAKFTKRPPVVVIMGHVDHGKTTLIDYIRKTNVAAKEKGGITQSVRVHNVKVSDGNVLIIDTPGHEAFSSMREVGARITDIAVIIVAADDGLMPQTIESIKIAKEMGVSIVVAINKIDKSGVEQNIENIKGQLAQHDVLVEDWGGPVVCVPISAKTGKGVDHLLEMLLLQSELMGLEASSELDAKAFVVESFIERGLGPCAVTILKQGVLNVGDNFIVAGSSVGKVKAMFGMDNKPLRSLYPYQAAKIVGLTAVAKTGEFLCYVSPKDLSRAKDQACEKADQIAAKKTSKALAKTGDSPVTIKVVLKSDGYGTADGLIRAIKLMSEKHPRFKSVVKVVSNTIGNIHEKDILSAYENNAVIFGMNVVVEKNAAEVLKNYKVDIKIESIIYRLVDTIEEMVIDKLRKAKELKRVGEGFVKKVFAFKNRGVIAGCMVTDGFFADKTVVHCLRGGEKVGEARVVSLQQDKKVMKEIPAGQDCGILCKGFSEWQEGDKVICFEEVSLYRD